MVNKSKAKGTTAETRVVNYLLAAGLAARRVVLKGSKDTGDVLFTAKLPRDIRADITLEVKGGKQTQKIGRGLREEWLAETRAEGKNAGTDSFLVVAKFGTSPPDFHVWSNDGRMFWYLDDFAKEMGGQLE